VSEQNLLSQQTQPSTKITLTNNNQNTKTNPGPSYDKNLTVTLLLLLLLRIELCNSLQLLAMADTTTAAESSWYEVGTGSSCSH